MIINNFPHKSKTMALLKPIKDFLKIDPPPKKKKNNKLILFVVRIILEMSILADI